MEILINTTHWKVDLLSESIDFAARHGIENYPGRVSEYLIHDPLWQVCSPQLLPSQELRINPEQLTGYPLLHDELRDDWPLWFTEHQIIAALKSVEASRTVKDVCREAAISEASYYNRHAKYGAAGDTIRTKPDMVG